MTTHSDECLLCLEGVNDGWLGDGHLYYGLPENAEPHQVSQIQGTHSNAGLPCPLRGGRVVRELHIYLMNVGMDIDPWKSRPHQAGQLGRCPIKTSGIAIWGVALRIRGLGRGVAASKASMPCFESRLQYMYHHSRAGLQN